MIYQSKRTIALAERILNSSTKEFSKFFETANEITNKIFGNNRILFNPIYISNICDGDCLYCAYRKSNKNSIRSTLLPDETLQEAQFLQKRGVNNILFLAGEFNHDKYLDLLLKNISIVIDSVKPNWVGIEVASLKSEAYKKLKKIGVKSVTIFQETYNITRYNQLHQTGIKSDYFYRLNTLHRAANSGIKEVGLGVLYGVGDWYTDTLAMIQHGLSLQSEFPDLKLRFSVPRLMESECQDVNAISELIDEKTLLKIIVTLRNCFPKESIVITGRESSDFIINKASRLINIIGKDGNTSVGGYCNIEDNALNQFELFSDLSFEKFTEFLKKEKYTINI